MDRRRLVLVLLVTTAACAPATPRIDGVPGAPPSPAETWPVPPQVKPPRQPASSTDASETTTALNAGSNNPSASLELSDVVDLALRRNPATRESWMAARAAADAYGATRGTLLLPSVDANVDAGRSSNASTNGATLGVGSGPANNGSLITTYRSQLTTSASLSYLLFDVGGRSGSIEQAKQRAIAADLTHNATVHDVILQVESALFSFLATRALRDAQIAAVHDAVADTAAAAERLRVGVATVAELLQTRTALAQARFQLATLEGDTQGAHGNLATAIGLPANAHFDVGDVSVCDTIAKVAASVDSLVNDAIVRRPEAAEVSAEAKSLAAAIRVARSAGYPALTLSSSAGVLRSTQNSTVPRNYSLFLGIQIPIFNGFGRQYDVRSAREEYEAGLARLASTRLAIGSQVFAAYTALQTATERVRAGGDVLTSAQQSADVALGRYREGVGTIVDLLLARTALTTARAEDIQARWEWRTALAQLAHDTGLLSPSGRADLPLSTNGSNDQK